MKQGVPVTPDRFSADPPKWVEEVAGSIPIAGAAQRYGISQANDGFVRGGINQALGVIGDKLPNGVKGTDAMKYLHGAFDATYDKARQGMHFEVDNQFSNEIGDVLNRAKSSPVLSADHVARLDKVRTSLGEQLAATGGQLGGNDLKKVGSDLQRHAVKLGAGNNSASDQELGHFIGDMADALDAGARRSPKTSPDAAALMDRADRGYAYLVRLENAAKQRGGEAGTFSANQLDRAVQRGDKTARNHAYSSGDALFQKYANAGLAVLPNKVPNSGTAERAGFIGLLGGGASFAPGVAAFGALGALPYAPIVSDAVRAALVNRNPAMLKAGMGVRKLAAPAGSALGLLAAGNSGR